MNDKTKRGISISLMALASAMLLFSAFMKITGADAMVTGLTAAGLGNYVTLIGIMELIAVILFLIPSTFKVGFLLVTSYLGGALSVELAAGQPPTAAVILTVIWVSAYLRNKYMFVNTSNKISLA
jgi:hypothetical protein